MLRYTLCYPRETSPRSFHSPRSIPQVAHVRGGLLRCASTNVRRPGVIHGVTPPGSVPLEASLSCSPGSVPARSHLGVCPEVSAIVVVSQVLKVFFVSAPRFDEGESAICGVRAGRGNASHKPSTHKWQRA